MRTGAWFLVLAFAIAPHAALGQDKGGKVPGKEGEEVQAEARGKKSNKVKISDAASFKLDGFPAGDLKGPGYYDSEKHAWDKIERLVPGLGVKIKKELPKLTNIRDRIVYLAERAAKLLERVDFLEANAKKKLVTAQAAVNANEARKTVVLIQSQYSEEYFDYLDENLSEHAVGPVMRAYNYKYGKHIDALRNQRVERRKKLGLPPIGSKPKPKPNSKESDK